MRKLQSRRGHFLGGPGLKAYVSERMNLYVWRSLALTHDIITLTRIDINNTLR